jgi:hypothetical protein
MNREGFNKHKDLILAWAAGATIQFLDDDGNWQDISTPSWLLTYEYRIKPAEPRVWYIPMYRNKTLGFPRPPHMYNPAAAYVAEWIRVVEDTSFVPDKPGA